MYGDLSGYVLPRHSPSISSLKCPIHIVIVVGEASNWLPGLVERAKLLKVNGGFEKGTDL